MCSVFLNLGLGQKVWKLLGQLVVTWLHLSGTEPRTAYWYLLVLLHISSKSRTATFFHLPCHHSPNCLDSCSDLLPVPQLPSQKPPPAASHFHHQPVDWVLQEVKVPRAYSNRSHTSFAIRINLGKPVQKTGFFPPTPVPSLGPHRDSEVERGRGNCRF